jgi:hypothetical protein
MPALGDHARNRVAPYRLTEDGQLAGVTPDNLKRKERHAADKRHNPRNDYSRGESDRTILETNSDTDDAQNDQPDAAEFLHQKQRAVSSVCGHDKPPAQVDVQVSPTIGADKSVFTLLCTIFCGSPICGSALG